jgi:transposase
MRAYSLDIRQRIVAAVRAGHPKDEVAELFDVDRSTINRYLRLAEGGRLAAKPLPGRAPHISPAQHANLVLQLHLHPADTLAEHCRRWEAVHGVAVSIATMSRAIHRVGWTRKKGHWQPGSVTSRPGLPGGQRR